MFRRLPLPAAVLFAGAVLCPLLVRAENVRQMSLEDCLRLAIEKNLGLRIARYDPKLANLGVHSSYSAYDPTFTSSAGQQFGVNPRNAYLDPSKFNPLITTETWNDQYTLGLGGLTPFGTTYSLNANLDRKNVTTTYSPTNQVGTVIANSGYTAGAGLSLRQPLLKDFWIDGPRLNIALAKNALKQSEEGLRSALFDLCTSVAQNYYDLVGAEETLEIQRAALALAGRSLLENRHRVEIGSLAPLSERQAEAQEATRRSDLISAEERLNRAINALNSLISDDLAGADGDSIHSTGGLEITPESLARQDSWHKALTLRPDIRQEKLVLESHHVILRYDRNQLFPQLDLTGSYGVVGNQLQFHPVLGDLADRTNPQFSYGIELKFPLSNRQARDRQKRDRLQLERELIQYKRMEQNAMREVNDFIFAANSAQARVATTQAARRYADDALAAEQTKLSMGTSTSFHVLQLQRDLVAAQTASIQSRVDFRKAMVGLARAEGTVLDRLGVNFHVE